MNVRQRHKTFKNGIGRGCVLYASHACPELSETQAVVWTLEPGPHIFLDIMCFVKGALVRFVSMPKFRVKKGLGKVTGALEALVEAVEAYKNINTVREPDEYVIQMPEDRCNPEGSYVLRFRANNFQFIVMGK